MKAICQHFCRTALFNASALMDNADVSNARCISKVRITN